MAKYGRNDEVVHGVVQKDICDAVRVLPRLYAFQVGVVVLLLALRVLRRVVIAHQAAPCALNDTSFHAEGEVFEDDRVLHIVGRFATGGELKEVGGHV